MYKKSGRGDKKCWHAGMIDIRQRESGRDSVGKAGVGMEEEEEKKQVQI